ncbi:MAG: NAD kinase [Bacteroidales bacterium]|jgi:NAD+ kinase|nr:NAD kinase [Bacteroidales bacterium]MDD4385025.1 NAD kinase [Bacteroidales bacterium]MDY0196667.1 NAD kinase [Tenuifilaceae bacterium]
MVIAIYGNKIESKHVESIKLLLSEFSKRGTDIIVFAPFYGALENILGYKPKVKGVFQLPSEVKRLANFMLSIGGDGTFLDSVSYIEDSCIPVVGINFGRLGFLAHIQSDDIPSAIEQIYNNDFIVEERSALMLTMENNPFSTFPFALNDLTVQKMGTTMITINAYIDDEFLCTYWADGLIVSTPTGSTAYSLSVGGPIVSPKSNSLIISPIAPHHLTVRPLVIPDNSVLTLEVASRETEILMSLDSRSMKMISNVRISISKAPFCIRVVRLKGKNFYETLRNKLMWGADSRNQ